jgi:hypothetical protein
VRSHLCIAAAGAIQSWKSRRHWSASPHARPAFIGRTAPVDELPALPKRLAPACRGTNCCQCVSFSGIARAVPCCLDQLLMRRALCELTGGFAMRAAMRKAECHHETGDRRCTYPVFSRYLRSRLSRVFCCIQPRKPVFSAVSCVELRPRTQQTMIDFGLAS